ncbi:MAG: phosphoribosylamine--glycine ligase [Methanomicrobiaceae archaeon]|nr:phosphoribosylamine--glycine ligase [Methanomicrobiaceae archaeon]
MDMKVLVVGGGGREHAITTALSRNSDAEIYAVMARKNPGIARLAREIFIGKETLTGPVTDFAVTKGIDIAVIGPEAPLEAGLVDALEHAGIPCVGPTRAAARLETDKAFCRTMMEEHGIAGCPRYRVFHAADEAVDFVRDFDGDLAVKPIGLTGGKGVRIMGEQVDREGAIAYIREIGGNVVLEERLIGEEITLQAFVDGAHLVPMPLVQDHKRAYEGDLGPNTGGMGSYSLPDHKFPFMTRDDYEKALSIMTDAVTGMAREGVPYRGILYGQFMNTADGPKVIEFNARFGDPEAMNVLSLLSSDFCENICHLTEGTLSASQVTFAKKATVCKYIVPAQYPEKPHAGDPIHIGDTGEAVVYYANVVEENGMLITQTSRSLALVGLGDTLDEAERIAESAASAVSGNVRHRRDIGTGAVLERRCTHMRELL